MAKKIAGHIQPAGPQGRVVSRSSGLTFTITRTSATPVPEPSAAPPPETPDPLPFCVPIQRKRR